MERPKIKKVFSDWGEAFDYCREANRPIVVQLIYPHSTPEGYEEWGKPVKPEERGFWKLFPSGKAEKQS